MGALAATGEGLINALRDAKGPARRKASCVFDRISTELREVGDFRAVECLIAALADDWQVVREHAAKALGKLGDARAVSPLVNLLNDYDEQKKWLRGAVCYALGKIGSPSVEPLIAALRDEDSFVRRKAAFVLGRIGDATAVDALVALLTDRERRVCINAVLALGQIGDARALEPLTVVLKTDAATVRINTVFALGKFGQPAVEPLIFALKDPDARVRKQTTAELGRIGDKGAIPELERVTKADPEDSVRHAANKALKGMNRFTQSQD